MNTELKEEYDKYFKQFYDDYHKYQSGKKKYSTCKGCDTKKRFIINNNKLTFSCGPKDNKDCGPQFTIEIPKYIKFSDLQIYHNEKINGSFNYKANNLLEYNLQILSKKMNVQKELENQQQQVQKSIQSLEQYTTDYIEQNQFKTIKDKVKLLFDKRYKNSFEKKQIMKQLQEDISEEEKKILRKKYAQLIDNSKEFIPMIQELKEKNNDYIMIEAPKIINHVNKTTIEEKKIQYSYEDQISILLKFYRDVDPDKTKEEIIGIINRRRKTGTETGNRIPTVPWLKLCKTLQEKYNINPLDEKIFTDESS